MHLCTRHSCLNGKKKYHKHEQQRDILTVTVCHSVMAKTRRSVQTKQMLFLLQTQNEVITESLLNRHKRPLLSTARGVWGCAWGLSKNLWIMNITNLPLNFKQPLCTKNMLDIEFQTLPQSDIKPAWIAVSFMDCTYVRLFIKSPYSVSCCLFSPVSRCAEE